MDISIQYNPCCPLISTFSNRISTHSLLPCPFIFLLCLIIPARFSFSYYLLFLPEPIPDAHGIRRFVSIDFLPLCTCRLIITILFLCRIQFLIECLNGIKFIFLHDSRKPLFHIGNLFVEYYPPWEPPVSRFRATRKWYFPPSEPPQHIVAAHIFDFTINLLIVILGELLMQYHQIIYREVFLCLEDKSQKYSGVSNCGLYMNCRLPSSYASDDMSAHPPPTL